MRLILYGQEWIRGMKVQYYVQHEQALRTGACTDGHYKYKYMYSMQTLQLQLQVHVHLLYYVLWAWAHPDGQS